MQSPTSADQMSDRMSREVRELVEKWTQGGKAEVVYGEPKVVGDKTIIPVAKISARGGGGGGRGAKDDGSRGGGMGMGVTMNVTPVGVVEISPSGTRFIPIMDFSKLAYGAAVGFILLLAFMRITRKKK